MSSWRGASTPDFHKFYRIILKNLFLDGIPPCTTQRDAWQLALTAQAAGYYAAAFETAAQAAARADVLDVYEADAARPAAVAKHLGRLIKHKLQK